MRVRVFAFLCLVSLLGLSARAYAAQNPFVRFAGSWMGVETFKNDLKVSVELLMSADGRYGERVKFNGKSSTNVGHYTVEKNVVKLVITDWNPKEQCGYGTCIPIAKPVDTSYRVLFSGANTMTFEDVNG